MDQHPANTSAPADSRFSLSHIVHTLRDYAPVIILSMIVVIIGYIIVATAMALTTPSQRITSQAFRLDFRGADRGEYPNGSKFSPSEIISTPVLVKVWTANNLSRFLPFSKFSRSVYVVESNPEQDKLAREYRARLSDLKLSAVDRDRMQREYELKLASISKNQYELRFTSSDAPGVPDELAKKILHDILREWSEFIVSERHVLDYRISILSAPTVMATPPGNSDPIAATQVLRAQVKRLQGNIDQLRGVPAAELVRTKDGSSLVDIDLRLDDIVRFRLDPLVHRTAASGLADRTATLRFLEAQLAYDQRLLDAQRRATENVQNALAAYMGGKAPTAVEMSPNAAAQPDAQARGTGEREPQTVMPQLSETFLERLVQLATNSKDVEYRQRLTLRLEELSVRIIPLEEAVAYDRAVLDVVRAAAGTSRDDTVRAAALRELDGTREEVRQLLDKVHEIYRNLSSNLNPSSQLVTNVSPPVTHVEHSMSFRRIALMGILTCALALPLIIIGCLLHNRIREEEQEEAKGFVGNVVETPL